MTLNQQNHQERDDFDEDVPLTGAEATLDSFADEAYGVEPDYHGGIRWACYRCGPDRTFVHVRCLVTHLKAIHNEQPVMS